MGKSQGFGVVNVDGSKTRPFESATIRFRGVSRTESLGSLDTAYALYDAPFLRTVASATRSLSESESLSLFFSLSRLRVTGLLPWSLLFCVDEVLLVMNCLQVTVLGHKSSGFKLASSVTDRPVASSYSRLHAACRPKGGLSAERPVSRKA